jgi:replication-associated recombination protein RarA
MEICNNKIKNWLTSQNFPARTLLSGKGNLLDLAIEIASRLQGISREKIESGIHADTTLFRDTGKSFRIDWSDMAKKAGDQEHENVKGMIKLAHQTPLSPYRIIILENIERVGREASHAMLKLIEEPASRVVFIFTTRNHHKLLDTIISRVSVVQVTEEEKDFEMSDTVRDFLEGRSLIQKFQIIEKLDKDARNNPAKKIDRTIFLNFLEDVIAVSRILPKYQKNLEILLETHNAITNNLSPKFSLERLALKIVA